MTVEGMIDESWPTVPRNVQDADRFERKSKIFHRRCGGKIIIIRGQNNVWSRAKRKFTIEWQFARKKLQKKTKATDRCRVKMQDWI